MIRSFIGFANIADKKYRSGEISVQKLLFFKLTLLKFLWENPTKRDVSRTVISH